MLGKAKFIYIAHFIHKIQNTKVLYIKGSEIDIKNNNHNNKNKELKKIIITTIKTRKLYKNVFKMNLKPLRIENDYT